VGEAGVRALERISLEPVLELEPAQYAERERSSPERMGDEAPGEWEKYWRDCLADSGLGELPNLRPGSWQVPIRAIGVKELSAILAKSVHAPLDKLDPKEDPVLDGGFALLEDGKPVVEAKCCGDLGDLGSWADLAAQVDESWNLFWIGHPQLSARRVGAWLELSEPREDTPPVPKWKVRPEDLDASVKAARVELERFVPTIVAALQKVPGLDGIEDLAWNLAGLGPWTRWKR